MPIEVRCECGRRLHAPDEAAGRRVRCPACQAAVGVPGPSGTRRPATPECSPGTSAQGRAGPPSAMLPVLPPLPRRAEIGENVFRPQTGGVRSALRKPKRKQKRRPKPADSGNASWWASLAFPFRTETLLSIGIMTVLLTFLFAPLEFAVYSPIMLAPRFLGGLVIVMLFVQGYFWHFLFQVLRTAAYNEPDLPLSADWDVENMVFDLRTAMGCTAVSFLPLAGVLVMRYWQVLSDHPFLTAAGVVLGVLCLPLALLKAMMSLPMLVPLIPEVAPHTGGMAALLMLAGCVYWPMALLASVLHETVRASLPWHVIPAIVRIPWAYTQTLLLIVLIAALGGVLQFLAGWVPLLGAFLTWFVLLSGLTAIMHRLGSMYHTKRYTLAWFPEAPRVV